MQRRRETASDFREAKGARLLRGAELTAARHRIGAAVCVHAKGMEEAWHLAASDATASASQIVKLYAKWWTIELGFREISARSRRNPAAWSNISRIAVVFKPHNAATARASANP